jgi:hypothetical protein
MKYFLKLFILLLSCYYVKAQWVPINGPGGGVINVIEKKGDTLAVIFKRDDHLSSSDMFRVGNTMFSTTDTGKNWLPYLFNPAGDDTYLSGINGLIIKDDIYYTSSWGGGVFKTFLYEGHWLTTSAGLKGAYITSLKNDEENIYAGIAQKRMDIEVGVYILKNGGNNWDRTLSKKVNCIKIIDSIVYAGCKDGIHYSNDSGNTWQVLSQQLETILYEVDDFFISGTRILAKSNNKIVLSTNNGINWKIISQKEEWGKINAVQITEKNLIIAADKGLYVSKDDGNTWESLTFNFKDQMFYTFSHINDTIYAGGNNGLLIYSPNGGDSWFNYGNMIPYLRVYDMINCGDNLLLATTEGNFYSNDEGSTWKYFEYDFSQTISKFASDNINKVFAASDNGRIFVSNDRGMSWMQLPNAFDESSEIINMVYDGVNLLIATKKNILYSTNKGASWQYLNWYGMDDILSVFLSENKIYASVNYEGIYLYDLASPGWVLFDNSWEYVESGRMGYKMVFDEKNIYSVNGGSLYVSPLNNINWETKISTDTGVEGLWKLEINEDELIIYATLLSLSFSYDYGNYWFECTDGLRPGLPYLIDKIIFMNENLYANTVRYGIWRRPYQEINTSTVAKNSHFKNIIHYPNPSYEIVYFTWPESKKELNLTIFNLQGQQILNKIVTKNNPVNIKSLNKGMYFYRLSDSRIIMGSGKLVIR